MFGTNAAFMQFTWTPLEQFSLSDICKFSRPFSVSVQIFKYNHTIKFYIPEEKCGTF